MYHSRKHRFTSSKPCLQWLIDDSQNFVNKMKWRLHFRGSPSSSLPFKIKGDRTPSCPKMVDPDFQPWSQMFRRKLLSAALSLSRSSSTSNHCRLSKLALSMMKKIPYVILLNDKDYGYSFVRASDMEALEHSALPETNYQPVSLAQMASSLSAHSASH